MDLNKDDTTYVTDKSIHSQATSKNSGLDFLEPNDRAAEKRLLRKLDLRVVPIIALLYTLAFLDRINIGNARIQGLEKDLHMKGQDFIIALMIFFIPYILFEVPSNLLVRKVAPSTWLSAIMVLWGIVTICQGVTASFGGLIACRFFLGLCEAGFFPGCAYLIAMYYPRHELQWRFSLFFCSSILAGAISGLLAYAISNMAGLGGYNGWRWIFIIEGLATVVLAALSKFIIVDWPEDAKFLTTAERELLLRRLRDDDQGITMDRFDSKARWRTFGDYKIYLGILMYMGITSIGYSTSFFTPTILKQLGWTSVHAQVMSIPIYIVAAFFSLLTAYLSDRVRHRFGFIIFGISVCTIGLIVLIAQTNVSVAGRYTALYIVMSGGYIAQPVMLVWLANNMAGHYKRSVNAAMQIGFGNIGGIIASNIFPTNEAPRFITGYSVNIALIWMAALAAVVLLVMMKRENEKRAQGKRDQRLRLPEDERDNLGDDHPHFRFVY